MQIININYENENGELIEELPINFTDVLSLLFKENFEENKIKYPWITTIDPYGDTVFNKLQWTHLAKEFNELKKEINEEKVKNILDGLVLFMKKNENHPHTYLKFYGD